ncbi:MAG: OmpH family outer membrane protein [Planctomycetota bacterium]|nr:MAG: OmpH family outer membrane protein [Planctomycetota bacterium]REJ95502.1 MAG: OmpH family outer membrane protein [Planctomycetota bacterium]REK27247.1 MAG: OmpH family outer membrane protein [Planctomycetota bacterium]REK36731.1 MAG: OmpH family outer membrane protein [Planctomycetota bacterium]
MPHSRLSRAAETAREPCPTEFGSFGPRNLMLPRRNTRAAEQVEQRSAIAVKKLIVCLAAAAVVVGTLITAREGAGQDNKPQSQSAKTPHQIGLIDMAHVFKEYEKFKALSDSLRAEVESSDAEAKAMVEVMQQLQAELTSGTLTEGSPEYSAKEQQLLQKQAELESFRKMKQRDFLRAEADIYKTVYLEVQDAVTKYAEYYNYTLIMRFNRAKVEDAENPQEIIQSMNRPVVFHRSKDDLTDPILGFLNSNYRKTAGAPAGGSTN